MAWEEAPPGHVRVLGRVVEGDRVAAGPTSDPRYPQGTLALQWPLFEEAGLDLHGLHRATVNVATGRARIVVIAPALTVQRVRWHPDLPPETFSFVPCQATVGTARPTRGHLYVPHREATHRRPDDVVEVLLPFRKEIHRGAVVALDLPSDQVAVARPPEAPAGDDG